MNIVIVGAGGIGLHLAELLSKQDHSVILVDKSRQKLEIAARHLDIGIKEASGTDWRCLEELTEHRPDMLLALTDSDETNLVICCMGKHLNYPKTIARIHNNLYINCPRLDFSHLFDVDFLIAPELWVAHDIFRLIVEQNSLTIENFAHGAVQMRTLTIPEDWNKTSQNISKLDFWQDVVISLIRRPAPAAENSQVSEADQIIFPHGDDLILPGDEVSFLGETSRIQQLHTYFGIPQKTVKSVVIVGGSLTAINLGHILEEQGIDLTVIDKDYAVCNSLAEKLPNSTILHQDGTNRNFLVQEHVGAADVCVACTSHDEINLVIGQLAKSAGCPQAIALLEDISYDTIAKKMGITHTLSSHKSTENQILSILASEKVSSIISLYRDQAEVLEVKVTENSKVIGIPISKLAPYLPPDLIFAMIQNRGRIMIANGNRVLSPGDTVITITRPQHIPLLRKIF